MGRKYTLANGASLYAQNGSTEFQLSNSTGLLYSNGIPQNYFEDASTATNLKPYGLSLLDASTAATTIKKYTLDAPIKGAVKELLLASTLALAGSSDTTIVYTGSSDIHILSYGTTLLTPDYKSITMPQPVSYARLVGLSTARWAMLAFQSGTTNVAFKALAGLSSDSTGIVST
jgi:hypothetical protein